MIPGKPEDKNSHGGELGGQLGAMSTIEIIESILGGTTLGVNSWDNIIAPRRTTIYLEGVK